ncbi:hypothetical protein LA080_004138 [Diaporthe eres]|nr:hypothetical protein LA080_004138 [Diaporthe eres]
MAEDPPFISTFMGPICAGPSEWGDHQGGMGVLQLWVLRSHSPGIRENQRPPPLMVQLPLAVCQSSYPMDHDICPNASFRIRGRQRPIAEPQRSGVRMGQKPAQGYAKTRHLDSRESETGASVPGHSSTA